MSTDNNTQDIVVTLRVNKNDDQLKELLKECKTNKERSSIVKKAVVFYVDNKDKFDSIFKIESEMANINNKLNTMSELESDLKNIKSTLKFLQEKGISLNNDLAIESDKNEKEKVVDDDNEESKKFEDAWAQAAKNFTF